MRTAGDVKTRWVQTQPTDLHSSREPGQAHLKTRGFSKLVEVGRMDLHRHDSTLGSGLIMISAKTRIQKILELASRLTTPDELNELVEGVLALRARQVVHGFSTDESALLVQINQGIPEALTNRLEMLLEKRDEEGLSEVEEAEMCRLSAEVERRGVERLESLSKLAAARGVSLVEVMNSLGITAMNHG